MSLHLQEPPSVLLIPGVCTGSFRAPAPSKGSQHVLPPENFSLRAPLPDYRRVGFPTRPTGRQEGTGHGHHPNELNLSL